MISIHEDDWYYTIPHIGTFTNVWECQICFRANHGIDDIFSYCYNSVSTRITNIVCSVCGSNNEIVGDADIVRTRIKDAYERILFEKKHGQRKLAVIIFKDLNEFEQTLLYNLSHDAYNWASMSRLYFYNFQPISGWV